MRGVAITDTKQVEIVDLPEPVMGPEDVLIEVQATMFKEKLLDGAQLRLVKGDFR